MSRLDKLINDCCPTGVDYYEVQKLCTVISSKNKIKSKDYLLEGKYPIIDQGQDFIGGYTNDNIVFPKDEYIIFGDHTCVVKFVDFEFAQGADGIKILSAKKDIVMPKFLYYSMSNIQLDSSYARHWSKMKVQQVAVPPLEVQREIVRILDSFTLLTAELTAELTARKKQYEYYRDTLLSFPNIEGGDEES